VQQGRVVYDLLMKAAAATTLAIAAIDLPFGNSLA
jgi:hypothetical protein